MTGPHRSATGGEVAGQASSDVVDAAAASFADAVEAYSDLEADGATFEAAEALGRADRSISDAACAAGIGVGPPR